MTLDPVSALLDIGGKVIDRIWPDPTQAAAAKLELIKLQQSGELAAMAGQLEINKAEAASTSVFVSGWRPFIGWVCGLGWCYNFLVYPALQWYAAVYAPTFKYPPPLADMLIELTFGMLGLATIRTFEKLGKLGKTGVK